MNVKVKLDPQVPGDELHIHCREVTDGIEAVLRRLESHKIFGRNDGGERILTDLQNVLYFESVDKKVFAYLDRQVLETDSRLYELEDSCPRGLFCRISKTALVNMSKISVICPEEGRRLKLKLRSGEWILVSRSYVKAFEKMLKEGMK